MSLPTDTSDNKRAVPAAMPARNKGARILYVDDEDTQLYLGKRLLIRLGHRATVFTDPLVALEAFRDRPGDFDLVITDLSMPQLTGLDFARGVRALRADVPIVMTSGYVRPEEAETARRIGIGEVIAKPVAEEHMRRALDRLLGAKPIEE